jgi:AraC family transcriptional regulator
MQEAYGLSSMRDSDAPVSARARGPMDDAPTTERDSRFARYDSSSPSGTQECSLQDLRQALADLVRAVSHAIQDKSNEAYGYVLRAAELLRVQPPGVTADPQVYDTPSAAPPAPRGGLAPWMIRKVSTYIESHLDSALSSAELAELAKLSVYHFSRAFRESFDEPPHTYIMRRRIERAQGMMLQTNLPLAQIAVCCGLADQPHLNKSFRRFVGQSPGAWRRARTARPQLSLEVVGVELPQLDDSAPQRESHRIDPITGA